MHQVEGLLKTVVVIRDRGGPLNPVEMAMLLASIALITTLAVIY